MYVVRRPNPATFGLFGLGVFASILVALHIMGTFLFEMPAYLSQFALRPYGWLFPTGIGFFIVGALAFGWSLWNALTPSRATRAGLAMVAIIALCSIIVAVFPADEVETTTIGIVHWSAAVPVFVLLAIMMFVYGWAFYNEPGWQTLGIISWVLGVVAVVSLALLAWTGFTGMNTVVGIPQRVAAMVDGTWLVMVLIKARMVL